MVLAFLDRLLQGVANRIKGGGRMPGICLRSVGRIPSLHVGLAARRSIPMWSLFTTRGNEVLLQDRRCRPTGQAFCSGEVDPLFETQMPQHDFHVDRAAQFGNGTFMSVAVLRGDYRLVGPNGLLDLPNTLNRKPHRRCFPAIVAQSLQEHASTPHKALPTRLCRRASRSEYPILPVITRRS